MRRPLLTATAAILLAGSPALAQPNLIEQIGGSGADPVAGFVDFSLYDTQDVESGNFIRQLSPSFQSIFTCFFTFNPGADIVTVNGSASAASADLSGLLDPSDCTGAVPASVTIDCSENGDWQYQFVGKSTNIIQGQRSQSHGNVYQSSATCVVTLDGVSVDASGFMVRNVSKVNP